MNYREELAGLADGNEEYAEFNRRIVNTKKMVIGVRLPDMRRMAKEIAKGLGAAGMEKFIDGINAEVYEEVLLAGLAIDYAKVTDAERMSLLRKWLPEVDSWAHIDSSTSRRKKFDRDLWWKFVDECLASSKEFVVRYGVIFMMSNFLDELPEVFVRLREVEHEGYYVKMGMAWLYAEAALHDYEMTMEEMRSSKIDAWTRRKALTKMIESYRISDKQKREIRELRSEIKAEGMKA